MPIVEKVLRLPGRVFPVQGWHALTEAAHRRRRDMPETARHRTPAGVVLDLDLADFVQRCIYYDAWELLELQFTERVLRPRDVMIDAGANVGLFALTGALRGAEVHAFEPIPDNFAKLEHNISLNADARVHAVRAALGAEAGEVAFGLPSASGNRAEMSAFTLGGSHNEVRAPMLRLDDYLDEHGIERVRLAKVDVEGAETLVFRGASRALEAQRIDLVVFEASLWSLVPLGFSLKDQLSTLTDAGYSLFRLDPLGRLTPYTYSGEPSLPERDDRTPGLVGSVRMGLEDRGLILNLVAVPETHPALRAGRRRLRAAAL